MTDSQKKSPGSPRIEVSLDADQPLIKASDFKSVEVDFELKNTTTGTPFRTDFKTRLTQLTEKGMMLEVPRRSCAKGHSLNLRLHIRNVPPSPDLDFQATVRVENLETQEKGGDAATISLVQFNEEHWLQLQQIFSRRQKEIQEFVAAARGF